jgi:hypothetical protein
MEPTGNSTADPFVCETEADCFNHGLCTENKCICWTLWTGDQCQTNKIDGNETIFQFFWIQNSICAALFLGIAIAALIQVGFLIERRRRFRRTNLATWTLFLLIAFVGIERVLYLMLDPYRYRAIIGAVAEEILFGLAIWGFVSIYLTILIIWMKMYSSTKNSEQFVSKLIKYIWIMMGVVLAVEVTYDVIRALYAVGAARTTALIVYFVIVAVAGLVSSIGFLVYGRLLYKRLSKFREHDPTRQSKLNKVMRFTSAASIIIISYAVALAALITVTLIYGEDITTFLIVHFLERLIEFSGCLAILITHHVNLKSIRAQSTTANSTNNSTRLRSNSATTTAAVRSSVAASVTDNMADSAAA